MDESTFLEHLKRLAPGYWHKVNEPGSIAYQRRFGFLLRTVTFGYDPGDSVVWIKCMWNDRYDDASVVTELPAMLAQFRERVLTDCDQLREVFGESGRVSIEASKLIRA